MSHIYTDDTYDFIRRSAYQIVGELDDEDRVDEAPDLNLSRGSGNGALVCGTNDDRAPSADPLELLPPLEGLPKT